MSTSRISQFDSPQNFIIIIIILYYLISFEIIWNII